MFNLDNITEKPIARFHSHPWLSDPLIERVRAELKACTIEYGTPGWTAICGPYGAHEVASMLAASAQLLGFAPGQDKLYQGIQIAFDGSNIYRRSHDVLRNR